MSTPIRDQNPEQTSIVQTYLLEQQDESVSAQGDTAPTPAAPPQAPQRLRQRQLTLWPHRLVALTLGGPCPLNEGYGEQNGELVWLDLHARYMLTMQGKESWLKAGYPVQIWINDRLAATVFPRRRRTRLGMPK